MVFLMMTVRIEVVYLMTMSYGILYVVVPNDINNYDDDDDDDDGNDSDDNDSDDGDDNCDD